MSNFYTTSSIHSKFYQERLSHLFAKVSCHQMNSLDSTTTPVPLPERKAHQGLLREELLVLRHIFNLNHGTRALDRGRLKSLGLSRLPDFDMKDLLIVSIDVENPYVAQLSKGGRYQVGLSILDTRILQSFVHDRNGIDPLDLLQTYQFCIGSLKYAKNASRTFCFGKSKHIIYDDLISIIQNLVSGRDVILVVQGGSQDLLFLQAAKIDLNPLYVLDTQKAAQHPLDLDHRCTIEEMLNPLQCPFGYRVLHVAGNDANYTLRALLLIAVIDAALANQLDQIQKNLLSTLEDIAKAPAPLNDREIKREERRRVEEGRLKRREAKREAKRVARLEAKTSQKTEITEELNVSIPDPT